MAAAKRKLSQDHGPMKKIRLSSKLATNNEHNTSSASTHTRFVEVFRPGPIFESLGRALPMADMVSLTRTCSQMAGLYQYLVPSQRNIDYRLNRFVTDTDGFRAQMTNYNALASGSLVREFFERASMKSSRLVCNVETTEEAEHFGEYLCQHEAYVLEKSVASTGTKRTKRLYVSKSRACHIALTSCKCLPIEHLLRKTCVTSGLNFFSWNKAFMIFPLPTIIWRNTFLLHKVTEEVVKKLKPECDVGLMARDVQWAEETAKINHPFKLHRRVGDRYTWTIPFLPLNVGKSKSSDLLLERSTFSIIHVDEGESYSNLDNYIIGVQRFSACNLRHKYIVDDAGLHDWLHTRLMPLTVIELWKIPEALRPKPIADLMNSSPKIHDLLEPFERPESWTYFDDDMHEWILEWEKLQHKKMREEQKKKVWDPDPNRLSDW